MMMRRLEGGRIFFSPSSNADMLNLGKADPPFPGGRCRSMMKMEEGLKRRLLFGCPQYMFHADVDDDDEYYEEQSSDKKRRLTSEQVELLEKSFKMENKVEPERKKELAHKLGLKPRQVAVWFQNRRARWKTKQLEGDYHHLKSSHDALLSLYNSLLKENHNLKAQVGLLTKKMQAKEVIGEEYGPPSAYTKSATQSMTVEHSHSSGGSAVVNDTTPPHLPDLVYSSYFHSTHQEMEDQASLLPPSLHQTPAQSDEPLGWFWPNPVST